MHRWSQSPAVWAGSTAVTSGGTLGPKAGVRACGELGKPSGLPPWRPQGASAAFLGRSWCPSRASRGCPR
jgi:hypothetical protein